MVQKLNCVYVLLEEFAFFFHDCYIFSTCRLALPVSRNVVLIYQELYHEDSIYVSVKSMRAS